MWTKGHPHCEKCGTWLSIGEMFRKKVYCGKCKEVVKDEYLQSHPHRRRKKAQN